MSNKKRGSRREVEEDISAASARRKGKKARKAVRDDGNAMKAIAEADRSIPKQPPKARNLVPIEGKTPRQKEFMRCINSNDITFGVGPAGTGKTYVGAGMACDLLIAGKIEKLYITRPVETCDEELGFTTGDLDEKFAVHLEPYWDVFHDRLGEKLTQYYLKQGRIVPAPLGMMRGRTFRDSWVILDEAQNTTKKQMKMFLTRLGTGSKMIVNGDLSQVDLKRDVMSGLRDALMRFKNANNIGIVQFKAEDSVRHGMLKQILDAYEDDVV